MSNRESQQKAGVFVVIVDLVISIVLITFYGIVKYLKNYPGSIDLIRPGADGVREMRSILTRL